MGKKLNPLETLERIKNAPTIYCGCGSDIYTRYPFECKEIEKALKALEIIKEKRIDITLIRNCKTVDDYNSWVNSWGCDIDITKKQFDLLKEVLL